MIHYLTASVGRESGHGSPGPLLRVPHRLPSTGTGPTTKLRQRWAGPSSSQVVGLRVSVPCGHLCSLPHGPLNIAACFIKASTSLLEVTVFCNLIMEGTSHYCGCILPVRRKLLVPCTLRSSPHPRHKGASAGRRASLGHPGNLPATPSTCTGVSGGGCAGAGGSGLSRTWPWP